MRRHHHHRLFSRAAVIVAGIAGSILFGGLAAKAQMPNINLMPEVKTLTPEEKEREAEQNKAYRESLRKIPNQSVNDPWGNVRGTEAKPAAPKAAPKATQAKRQTKSDGTAN